MTVRFLLRRSKLAASSEASSEKRMIEGRKDYIAEECPDEDWNEILVPIEAAYECGWKDGAADAIRHHDSSAARNLVRCLYLYSGHRVDSRGPYGEILAAIKAVAPSVGAQMERGDRLSVILAGLERRS